MICFVKSMVRRVYCCLKSHITLHVAKERIVGFYSTGPKIREADLQIDQLFRRYCLHPVLLICDVRASVEGSPTNAYGSVEEVGKVRRNEIIYYI